RTLRSGRSTSATERSRQRAWFARRRADVVNDAFETFTVANGAFATRHPGTPADQRDYCTESALHLSQRTESALHCGQRTESIL
ncbi:hypothetical protein, partial [Amycolatopsis sp. NPDC059021]|uniref:hypothetical protein n=1 Tax=Amycolatopsis sp. NPDC059021 TaxID=3346704 RepID=UPI003670200E